MQVSLQPKIYVAGHRGMVGSAIVRALQAKGYTNLVTRTHAELDLTNQAAVRAFFQSERPTTSFSPPPRSAASTPTTPTRPNSSTKT